MKFGLKKEKNLIVRQVEDEEFTYLKIPNKTRDDKDEGLLDLVTDDKRDLIKHLQELLHKKKSELHEFVRNTKYSS